MIPAPALRTPLRRVLVAVAAAAVLALLLAEGAATGYAPTAAATVVTGALCVGALAVPAGRFPAAAAGAVAASAALSLVTMRLSHRPEVTPGAAETAALLLLVTRAVRRTRPALAACLVAASSLAAALLPLRLPRVEYDNVIQLGEPVILFALLLAFVLGLYLRLLDTFRTREREADRQTQRLEYARELHDFVAHHVTAIVAQTKAVRYATAQGHAPAADDLDRMMAGIERAGSQAIESMRGMVSVLRAPGEGPAAVRPSGDLAGALRALTEEFTAAGPATVVLLLAPELRGAGHELPPGPATAAHRVVRESLTNVRKHGAGARRVTVEVRPSPEGTFTVSVTDDGRGPSHAAARTARPGPADGTGTSAGSGFGLTGLAERVEALGGTFTAGPAGEGAAGWRVTARLPLGSWER
ncbi:sensor histidine kinase [Streptomyces sp. AA1529]|uniref:sensor histidine kinase n=1 Tax=Streptomyces sp. AA1529 TaxID=1203257 RepID=UPI0002DC425B|nr:ATP-binding protein [Streptomyces sp. AA1529]